MSATDMSGQVNVQRFTAENMGRKSKENNGTMEAVSFLVAHYFVMLHSHERQQYYLCDLVVQKNMGLVVST